jgi:hypothetical protein
MSYLKYEKEGGGAGKTPLGAHPNAHQTIPSRPRCSRCWTSVSVSASHSIVLVGTLFFLTCINNVHVLESESSHIVGHVTLNLYPCAGLIQNNYYFCRSKINNMMMHMFVYLFLSSWHGCEQ